MHGAKRKGEGSSGLWNMRARRARATRRASAVCSAKVEISYAPTFFLFPSGFQERVEFKLRAFGCLRLVESIYLVQPTPASPFAL